MKTNHLGAMVPVLASFFAFTALSSAALAADPCGKFDFSSSIDCEIKVEGGCTSQCTPLKFEAACNGACDATFDVTCAADCKIDCLTECDPGSIDCKGSCGGQCQSRCNAACDLDDCSEQCAATCDSECSASCSATPPSCETSCQQSCEGACAAEANIDCDVDCYSELQGGCTTQCEDPSGALFCNGQYVSASDVDECITYIQDNLNGEVNVEARGEVTCDLNGCEGSSSANGMACSSANVGVAAGGTGALAALALGLGAVIRRRRND